MTPPLKQRDPGQTIDEIKKIYREEIYELEEELEEMQNLNAHFRLALTKICTLEACHDGACIKIANEALRNGRKK